MTSLTITSLAHFVNLRPMAFLSEMATNATNADIGVVIYSGNNDALIGHRGTEVTIQVQILAHLSLNTTDGADVW